MNKLEKSLYADLGDFSDWVVAAERQRELFPAAQPGPATRQRIQDVLGFEQDSETPSAVRVERCWERDGVSGEEVSWSVGYGPRTYAWVLKPAGCQEALPGVLALHSHDGIKYFGKEKIANGPVAAAPLMQRLRKEAYGGQAFANELAKQSFVVLVHDTFLWGSRRFSFEAMPAATQSLAKDLRRGRMLRGRQTNKIELYDIAARQHEYMIEKYCTLLGTTLAGVVSYEDRVATRYLQARPDVQHANIGCIGLSGGGCRAGLLAATCPLIKVTVIVGMMSTYAQLLNQHVAGHTGMFFPAGLARYCDWSDLVASRAPAPLLVQYNRSDPHFSLQGMQEAHQRITACYQTSEHPDAYRGEFYAGQHKFDLPMQKAAFSWLAEQLASHHPSQQNQQTGVVL